MAKVNSTGITGGLTADDVTMIRSALLIGLCSYGEVMRLRNTVDFYKEAGKKIPDWMNPIDPTGTDDTVCEFAEALRILEHGEVKVAHG